MEPEGYQFMFTTRYRSSFLRFFREEAEDLAKLLGLPTPLPTENEVRLGGGTLQIKITPSGKIRV